MKKEKNKMRYLKLYEAFRSEILSKTLSFVSPDTKTFFIEKIEAVCKSIDFPMSELTDDFFQRMSFEKALDLFVDENHQVGKIKWIKFWFDKEGKYITTTAVDGSVEKKDKGTKIDNYEVIKDLDFQTIKNELKTGDKVYITLDYGTDPLITTVFRYTHSDGIEKIYMIQNVHEGTEPRETFEWQVYGEYSWLIASSRDFEGVPKLVKPKYAEEGEETNPYLYNFVVSTWGRMSLRKGESSETEKYLKKASFAIVLDFDALQSSTYKTKSSIETERSDSKKGALAFMTDHEIKSKNLQRYFTEAAKNIKFSEDLSNIKSLTMKLLGGNKLFMYIFNGQFYPLKRLIQEVYSFIKISEINPQTEYTLEVKRTIIYNIERNIKETSSETDIEEEFKRALDELTTLDLEDDQVRIPQFNEDTDTYIIQVGKVYLHIRNRDELPQSGAFELFILNVKDEVIGFIRGTKKDNIISFNLFYIFPEERGMGIGSDIYKYFLNNGYTIKSDDEITDSTQSLYLNLLKEKFKPIIYDDGRVGLKK